MVFFGIVFIVSTTLVMIFKKEVNDHVEEDEEEFTVKETYFQMWKILWLAPVKKLILILMTVKVINNSAFNILIIIHFLTQFKALFRS